MLETSLTITFLIGLIGMGIIFIRKIPVLAKLSPEEIKEAGALRKITRKIKDNGTFKSFSGELVLQKVLSKIRIITLKTDNKTGIWLAKLRQRTLKKKNKFLDDYWQKVKKR